MCSEPLECYGTQRHRISVIMLLKRGLAIRYADGFLAISASTRGEGGAQMAYRWKKTTLGLDLVDLHAPMVPPLEMATWPSLKVVCFGYT